MNARPLATGCLLAHVLAACAATPPPEVAPTVPSVPAPVASAPPEPAPDLSEVPPPPALAGTLHLAHPAATLRQVMNLLGGTPLAQVVSGGDPEALVDQAAGAPVGALVDLDAPLDIAMSDFDARSGEPLIAVSMALREPVSARVALAESFEITPEGPGAARLEPRGKSHDARPCLLAAAPGTGSRLVCGTRREAVKRLGPYLVRTMGRLASPDDLRVEAFVRALTPPDAGADTPDAAGDRIGDWLEGQLRGLGKDVSSVILTASVGARALDLGISASFDGRTSPLGQALLGQPAPVAPPSPVFDRLPADADVAWYGRGVDAAALAPFRASVYEVLGRALEDDGYAQDAATRFLEALRPLMLTGGVWAVAAGHPVGPALAALDAHAASGKGADASRARAALRGWIVAGLEEPPQRWLDGMRALVKIDAIAPVRKPRKPHEPTREHSTLSLAPLDPALALPAGTLHVAIRVTENPAWVAARKKAKEPPADPFAPRTDHLFVVPDGARTWIAAGSDASLAASAVRRSLAGAPDSGALSSRADLASMRAVASSGGGFLSPVAIAAWAGGTSDASLHDTRATLARLAALPDHGRTPVSFTTASTPTPGPGGAASGGQLTLRVSLPLEVLALAASFLSP